MEGEFLKIKISQINDLAIPDIPGWFQLYDIEGRTVRNDVYIDFTEAGSYLRYDWMDKGEFAIACHDTTEIIPDLVHELAEVCYTIEHNLDIMNNDDDYTEAHDYASSQEQPVRDDPSAGMETLKKWLDKYTSLRPATEAKSMATMLHKAYDFEVKEISDRILEFTGSTETLDRDGEVIKADGWILDNYQKNPVVLYGHDYSSLPVAKCLKAWVEGGKLKFRDQFATADEYEYADTVYKLCKGGYLSTVSVGFIPLESENGKGEIRKIWTKQELLEHSIVAVPSNPDALVSARNAGVITTKEFERITKPDHKEGKTEEPPKPSQGEIKDEIDFLDVMIDESGLADTSIEPAIKLAEKILRITGSDRPDEIKTPIRSYLQYIQKAFTDHHQAHEKWYEGCNKALGDAMNGCPEDNKNLLQDAMKEAFKKFGGY